MGITAISIKRKEIYKKKKKVDPSLKKQNATWMGGVQDDIM